jgi:hypothetical protein
MEGERNGRRREWKEKGMEGEGNGRRREKEGKEKGETNFSPLLSLFSVLSSLPSISLSLSPGGRGGGRDEKYQISSADFILQKSHFGKVD